jgi:hypothetical protein
MGNPLLIALNAVSSDMAAMVLQSLKFLGRSLRGLTYGPVNTALLSVTVRAELRIHLRHCTGRGGAGYNPDHDQRYPRLLAPPPSPACGDSPTKSVKSARLRALRVGEVDWRSARRWSIELVSRILSIARFGGGLPRFRSGEGISSI